MNATIHKNLGHINVLDEAAVPDGTTDNTAAFTAAFTAAQNRPHDARVYVPAGDYAFAPANQGAARFLYQNLQNFYLEGAGHGLTRLLWTAPNTAAAFFGLVNCRNIEITGIQFDGRCTLENQKTDYNTAVDIRGSESVRIHNNRFAFTGDTGLRISQTGPPLAADPIPPGGTQTRTVSVYNNEFYGNRGEGGISTKSGGASQVHIVNNHFQRQGVQAISFEGESLNTPATAPAQNAVITGNVITDVNAGRWAGQQNSYGITIQENAWNVTVADNQIHQVEGQQKARGVHISTSPNQSDSVVGRVNVHGNTITNVRETVANRSAAIGVEAGEESAFEITINGNQTNGSTLGVDLSLGPFGAPPFTAGRSSIQYINIVNNTITADEFGVITQGGLNSANPDFSRPADIVNIGNNIITAGAAGAAWRGIFIFVLRGNVHGNTILGPSIPNSAGIELLDDPTLPSTYTSVQRFVNNNAIYGVATDVSVPFENIAMHQLGEGYEWFDGTGDHRNQPQKPNSLIIGDITGTET